MEECYFTLNYDDFVTMMMGCGVGYFLIGYLITSCLFEVRNRTRNRNQLPILAHPIRNDE